MTGGAELAARIVAGEACLIDFRHAVASASLATPPDMTMWCARLAQALGDLLAWLELHPPG
jgi:hypothetical protein